MAVASPPPIQSAVTPRPRGLLLYLETTAKLLKCWGIFGGFFQMTIEAVE